MAINNQPSELLSCENYIMARVEFVAGIVGKKEKNGLIGAKKEKRIFPFLTRLRVIGAFFLYFTEVYRRKRHTASIFQNKIVYSDHGSKLIQRRIFGAVSNNDETNFKLQYLQNPFFNIMKGHRVLFNVFKSFKRTKPSSSAAVYELYNFWIYYTIYSDWLFHSELSAVLVVDDFSTKRMALVIAAKDAGLRVGIVQMSDEPDRPFPFQGCDVLFCWNIEQSYEKESLWCLVTHLQRSVQPMEQLAVDHNQQLRIGIAVNAFFNKHGLIDLLKKLDALEWVGSIVIRFHPNTKPIEFLSEVDEICFDIADAEPELFFETIDLLVCGRTSLIKDALLWGVPVAFDASLDVERKVSYGHLTNGTIIDMSENQWDTNFINEINLFYQSDKWKKKRDQWILPDPRAVSLKKALEYLVVLDGEQDNAFK